MAEREKDDVGTTGDGLGEAEGRKVNGQSRNEESAVAEGGSDARADSKGTLNSGTGDTEMTQASGGSVD